MKNKKYIIAGLIGLVTISGAFAYLQYQKLMDYVLGFKGIKIKGIMPALFDFDIILSFKNNSNIKFTLVSQSYEVYINNVYLTTMLSNNGQLIEANAESLITLNVRFNPKEALQRLKITATTLVTDTSKIQIKVVTKLKVKYGVITATIPYTYENNLKSMMA
jgi:LEA14-like dessication related protein